jgi:hypothetical protein
MPSSHIFLSYAREDAPAAKRLYKALTSAGAQVWFDQVSLPPGARWQPTIRKAIREARYFIALLSPHSVTKRGFVQREIREALDVLATFPDNEIYVIPVRLERCTPTHEPLSELNWIDLFPRWTTGLSAIRQLLKLSPKRRTGTFRQRGTKLVRTRSAIVRYDGLYQTVRSHPPVRRRPMRHYLRFFPDGRVFDANFEFGAREAERGLRSPPAHWTGVGKLTKKGKFIRFSMHNVDGAVDYFGTRIRDRMIFLKHSHITGMRGIEEYRFVRLKILSRVPPN